MKCDEKEAKGWRFTVSHLLIVMATIAVVVALPMPMPIVTIGVLIACAILAAIGIMLSLITQKALAVDHYVRKARREETGDAIRYFRRIEPLAKCEEGYLCDVCGGDVESITESDLYLRFVIGMVDPETLHTTAERHIRCNPALAQFIVDPDFQPIVLSGDFDKRQLDQAFCQQREELVTRGWRRLREIEGQELPIVDYPLPEVRQRLTKG